jgi:6-phosphogluconolactonase
MDVVVLETLDAAAAAAAEFVVHHGEEALTRRGRFTIALSGGTGARSLCDQIAKAPFDWASVHVFQVDERAAPDASDQRHLTALRQHLLAGRPLPRTNVHPMPVGMARLADGATRYAEVLRQVCGSPPILDLVQLDLGPDGHTASLFPGDPASATEDADVAATRRLAGWERLTLTVPVLRRARCVIWLAVGPDKAEAVCRLIAGADIPATRLARHDAVIFTDRAAASLV